MTQQPWAQPQQQYPPQQSWGQQWGQQAAQPAAPAVQAPDAATMFDNVGGGPPAGSFKFEGIGDFIEGEVESTFATVVTDTNGNVKYYPPKPGRPLTAIPQLNVTIQTNFRNWEHAKQPERTNPQTNQKEPIPPSEDTGLRRIYIKYDMTRAVGVALRNAGVGPGVGVQNGGRLKVVLTGFKPTSQPNPLPLYEAFYQKPATSNAPGFFDQPAAQQQDPTPQTHRGQAAAEQQSPWGPPQGQQGPPPAQPPASQSPWDAPRKGDPPF